MIEFVIMGHLASALAEAPSPPIPQSYRRSMFFGEKGIKNSLMQAVDLKRAQTSGTVRHPASGNPSLIVPACKNFAIKSRSDTSGVNCGIMPNYESAGCLPRLRAPALYSRFPIAIPVRRRAIRAVARLSRRDDKIGGDIG